MIIYGYRALSTYLQNDLVDIERLKKSDWDILLTEEEFEMFYDSIPTEDFTEIKPIHGLRYFIKTVNGNYDIHIIDTFNMNSNSLMYLQSKNNKTISDNYSNEFNVVSLHTLYELKKSHRFIRRNHDKTMNDFYFIENMIELDTYTESEFYIKRFEETLIRANKKASHIKLDQNKNGFFKTKGITYIYDHDSIHESIKFHKVPIYKKYLKNGEGVLCDRNKWENLSEQEKKEGVLEEAYVIAIERFLSKSNRKTPKEAFDTAVEKICTTLCKGWFRQYAYENYKEIKEQYDEEFWVTFQDDLEKGNILSFQGENYS